MQKTTTYTNELSIIIVNYNGEKYLKNCFDSIYKKCSNINFEIVVIDNNSKDNSVSLIKNNYKKVKLIESKNNLGFAKGNNEAVKHANGKYVLLLNNDTILLNTISSAIKLLEQDKTIGAVGIKMLNGEKKYTASTGKFPSLKGISFFSSLNYKKNGFSSGNFKKDSIEVDWLAGCFVLLSKELYQQINGFDEDYFMYVEDVDFCKKIASKNKKRLFLTNLSYIHFGGFNPERQPQLIDSYFLYVKKHMNNSFVLRAILRFKKLFFSIKSILKK